MIEVYQFPTVKHGIIKNTELCIKRSSKSYSDQKQRCNNPRDTRYKGCGAKGIQVIYSREEFSRWYKREYDKKEHWKRPTVIRINSKDHYKLGNVQLTEGTLNRTQSVGHLKNSTLNPIRRKAYKCWKEQRQRCNNKKNSRYKFYGGKGIKVEYTALEFMDWFQEQWEKIGPLNRPNVARIDHNENYRLKNIELVECSDNVIERNNRVGNPTDSVRIKIVNLKTQKVHFFRSQHEAHRALGVSESTIRYQLNTSLSRTPRSGWKISLL